MATATVTTSDDSSPSAGAGSVANIPAMSKDGTANDVAGSPAVLGEDSRTTDHVTAKEMLLSRKDNIMEEMEDISKELQELKLLGENKALEEEQASRKRAKKKRRRRRKASRNKDDDRTQLPRSVRKFIDRMLARSKKKKSQRGDLSDFSDDDSDIGDDADHPKKSPIPFHLLNVPKSKIRLLTPTLDIETGSLNILHSCRGSMFGSVRVPVYRQFPNNHFQAAGRLKMAYTDARLPAQRAMEKLAETLFEQQDLKRPREPGNGIFNLYTDRMLVQSTKDPQSSAPGNFYHSYLPLVIQMERGAEGSRAQRATSSSPRVENVSSPSPAASGSRVTTAVLSLASLTVSETATVAHSVVPDQPRKAGGLMNIRQKTTVPRITVNKPITRNFGVEKTSRAPAQKQKDLVKVLPLQKHMLHPGFAISDATSSTNHLLHSFLQPTALKRSKEDYIVRKVY